MALINVDNSSQTYGDVKSLSVRDSAGNSLFYVEPGVTTERASYLALAYSKGLTTGVVINQIAYLLGAMFDSQMSLYSVQRMLNDGAWETAGLHASAERDHPRRDNVGQGGLREGGFGPRPPRWRNQMDIHRSHTFTALSSA